MATKSRRVGPLVALRCLTVCRQHILTVPRNKAQTRPKGKGLIQVMAGVAEDKDRDLHSFNIWYCDLFSNILQILQMSFHCTAWPCVLNTESLEYYVQIHLYASQLATNNIKCTKTKVYFRNNEKKSLPRPSSFLPASSFQQTIFTWKTTYQ